MSKIDLSEFKHSSSKRDFTAVNGTKAAENGKSEIIPNSVETNGRDLEQDIQSLKDTIKRMSPGGSQSPFKDNGIVMVAETPEKLSTPPPRQRKRIKYASLDSDENNSDVEAIP